MNCSKIEVSVMIVNIVVNVIVISFIAFLIYKLLTFNKEVSTIKNTINDEVLNVKNKLNDEILNIKNKINELIEPIRKFMKDTKLFG